MIGTSCCGKPGTRALTVADADPEGFALVLADGLALAEADAVAVGAADALDDGLPLAGAEQPTRARTATATPVIRPPRRFLNFTATRILRTFSIVQSSQSWAPPSGRGPGQV